ncbi:Serine/threonine-protein kinase PrkC [Luteitalea pratensis]|uniref:Serine/threonine-protein kinase PrkC n=1 Tax=Luteitalea pratensis TaxID=1855912 RepID=A0A143PJ61_LUTPR|nr:serine/threonine-protein kinase [Luteitalea pratensis]AMY08270.1 Serine/threonine-protein kinase PrkC [Luteitalea pratensis]
MNTPASIAHYQLLELIGQDGPVETWRARDARLQRTVAIQVLRRGPNTTQEAIDRFRRQAHVASLVTHPHICAVHNWGEDDGQPYVVRELLSGERLDQLLARGALAPDRVLELAIQLTGALCAVHRRGLVHGQLRPSHIRVTADGHVKVLGLGTAVADPNAAAPDLGAFATTAVDIETAAPFSAPTEADPYLSPEQVAGHPPVAVSDVFATGVLLYEMATGTAPFSGATGAELSRAILSTPPVPVRRVNRRVPAALAELIERALAKDPHQRQGSAQELLDALRDARRGSGVRWRPGTWGWRHSAVVAGALAVVAAGGLLAWSAGWIPKGPARARNTVLLSDIVNGTADPDFQGTLRQAVGVYLGQSPYLDIVSEERMRAGLQLMGRTDEMALTHDAAAQLCQRLAVQAMLEGSVSAVGPNTVINLVATDCENGTTIAREQAEVQRKEDVLRLLGTLTASVRTALGEPRTSLTAHNVPIEDATTPSLEALKAYTEAAAQRAAGREMDGIRWLEKAIAADPGFALAYTTLSTAYGGLGETGRSEQYARLAYEKAARVSERERLFIAYQYHDRVTGDQLKTREVLEVWSRTYPRDYRAPNALAVLLNRLGDFQAAAVQAEEARRRNPAHAFPLSNLAHARRGQGRFAEARSVAEQAIAQQLETVPMRRLLYQVTLLLGDPATAQQQVAWASSRPRGFDIVGAQAQDAAFHGRLDEARDLFGRVLAAAEEQKFPQIASGYLAWSAVTEALLGDRTRALAQARDVARTATAPEPALRAALALALAGAPDEAAAVVEQLRKVRPEDTFLQVAYVPAARAATALARSHPAEAVDTLRPAAPYQFGFIAALTPTYLEGAAYAQAGAHTEAARMFRLVVEHRGTDPFSPFLPMAQLGLARALAAAGDRNGSRRAYETLMGWWANADKSMALAPLVAAEYAALSTPTS